MTSTQPPTDAQLLGKAHTAATHAYAPYSNFRVGAALLLDDHTITVGCNIENASYGLTLCAERTAISAAFATTNYHQPPTILAAAIVGGVGGGVGGGVAGGGVAGGGVAGEPCYPCGACRQVLAEFGCQRIIVETPDGPTSIDFAEILPHPFGGPGRTS